MCLCTPPTASLVNSTSATANDFQGGWDAVAHLYAHGHRSIGGIFKSTDNQGIQRYRGVIEAMQHYGLHYSDDAFLWFQDNSQLESLLKTDLPLTRLAGISAMVCYNDQVSRQILQALAPHGICVPDELSIISFDNSIFAEYTQPPLTSLSHPKAKLGQAAAETLISMISGKAVHSPVLDWEPDHPGQCGRKNRISKHPIRENALFGKGAGFTENPPLRDLSAARNYLTRSA